MDFDILTQSALNTITKNALQNEPLDPGFSSKDLELIYSLAYAQYENKEFKASNDLFQKLCVFNATNQKYWIGLGATFRMLKEFNMALVAWSMAAILNDSDPSVHFQAAICYFHLNQKKEALKALEESTKRLKEDDSSLQEEIDRLEKKLNPSQSKNS